MKLIILFLLLNFTLAESKELIIVSGYAIENNYLDIHEECPTNTICSNSWFKYKIKVNNVILGEKLDDEVIAIKKQHASLMIDKSELAVFVLSKIKDTAVKRKFNAKYYVHEFSRPKTIYCFNENLEKLGLEHEDEVSYHPFGMWNTQCINREELLINNKE